MKLQEISQISALGTGGFDTEEFLFNCLTETPLTKDVIYAGKQSYAGLIRTELPVLPESYRAYDSRAARILARLVADGQTVLNTVLSGFDPARVGVVLGTSNSGIMAAEDAFIERENSGVFPKQYNYSQQEIGSLSSYLRDILKLRGPAYTVSTACTSGAKAICSAKRLVESGVCDLVIAGGIDAFCKLTLSGFSALELVSTAISNPFSKNRDGLNLGEAGALFFVAKELDSPYLLAGVGESGDAYHISSPDPQAKGAISAMQQALNQAGERPENVAYLNLHGTGTLQNDSMESLAVSSLFGSNLPCSSSKPVTGHTLGAAGAIELAFCCRAFAKGSLPLHRFDSEYDPGLPALNLVTVSEKFDTTKLLLSNSFAFGGSNCCLAIRMQ